MIVINEAYNAFKDMKIDDKNGQWTDGMGHRYSKNRSKSDVINHKGMTFQYDYDKQLLTICDNGKTLDQVGLNIGDWLDNPEYWLDQYYNKY